MHIGVTPEELKQADDLSLPIKQANPSPVHQNLYQYIDQDLPSYIEQLEREHQYPLEEDYRQLLLEDVKKNNYHNVFPFMNNNKTQPPHNMYTVKLKMN